MNAVAKPLPRLSDEVVLRQVGPRDFVVKQRKNRKYFGIGETEYFLLSQLDGQRGAAEVCAAFESQFDEKLTVDELDGFLDMAREQGLLQGAAPTGNGAGSTDDDDADDDEFGSPTKQSWLYFRMRLFDPTPILNLLEPRIRWLWTPQFVVFAVVYVAAAVALISSHRADFGTSFHAGLRWETVYIAWLCIVGATVLHEFAHGFTCKHFGGDVQEIGLLMIFGMPGMYCDVTDSWMIPSRTQRLWVTLAGNVSDLMVFATATFIWRLTMLDTLVNYMAWVLATVCGTRVFLNLNPLLRLDGYYLASDWFQIPNLRKSANAYWKETLRHLLWGAPPPVKAPRSKILLLYGITSWLFSLTVLDVLALSLLGVMHKQFGLWGVAVMCLLMFFVSKRVFRGLFTSEFVKMIKTRKQRTMAWGIGIAVAALVMAVVPVDRTATGQFEVRPGVRYEVRSEVAGFVDRFYVSEGDSVHQGQLIARLQIPDLESGITRKKSEIHESEAQLRKLKMGSRPEEIAEQREKVRRATDWRDLALQDLDRARTAYEQDLLRMDLEIQKFQTELDFEKVSLENVERLHQLKAISGEARRAEQKKYSLIQTQLAQVSSQKLGRQAEGVRVAEAEAARREKELADTDAVLKLLLVGTRPEEIDAEAARRARLQEELNFLESQYAELEVRAAVDGVVATPRLQEKVGQLSEKGGLLCVLEDVRALNVETAVTEQDIHGIALGQTIRLKARSLPFDCFESTVTKIAPMATTAAGKTQGLVTVYSEVNNEQGKLKSGMTGYARIYRGQQSIAMWAVRQGLGYLRTEFWW